MVTARQQHRRVAVLVLLLVAATVIAASEPFHRAAISVIELAKPVIENHVLAGAIVYVVLSALSAMVVFFSAAVITPIAVDAFGPLLALLLLWLGWILGGLASYAIGRFLGHRVVSWFVDPRTLSLYESRAKRLVLFRHVLLFQLAVPSEVPGYVLGLAGCRFRTYATAMALGELPFAIGAIYLGESFLEGNPVLFFTLGITGVAFSWLILRRAAALWSSETTPSPETRPPDSPREENDRYAGVSRDAHSAAHAPTRTPY